jgi:hypothetical protein
MGANFCTMSVPATLERKEIEKEFRKAQEQDRYENGHSYSGGFGMASGLAFKQAPTFSDHKAAAEWLADDAQKWESALAVQFTTLDGTKMWLIGAWCAS